MRWPGTAAARTIMLRYALAGPRSPDGCSKETRRGIISRTSYNNHHDTTHRIIPATNVRQLVSTPIPGHREAPVRRTERRRPTEAAIMKAEGVTAGVTDLILLLGRGGFNALCIEMKTPGRRSVLSDAQIEWRSLAITNGNRHVVCRTIEEFQSEIRWYLTM